MRIRFWCIILLFAMVFLSILGACAENTAKPAPSVENGEIDLRGWDFDKDGVIKLHGQWEFYWKQLLEPSDFMSRAPEGQLYTKFPSYWNNKIIDGKKLDGMGYATFRVQVKIDKPQKILALKLGDSLTSYKLWINGKLLSSDGIVGTNKNLSQPSYNLGTVQFHPHTNTLEIVLQIANYYHKKGGHVRDILLGNSTDIIQVEKRQAIYDMFFVGALVLIGMYYFGLYILRRVDLAPFSFAAFTLAIAVRALFSGEIIFFDIFPLVSFEMAYKIEYISVIIATPIFARFLYYLFPKIVKKIHIIFIEYISIAYILIVMFSPALFFSKLLIMFQGTIVIWAIAMLIILIIAVRRKIKNSLIMLISSFILFLGFLNDILTNMAIIKSPFMFTLAFFIFIFLQSFILSRRWIAAFNKSEELSEELEKKNIALNEFSNKLEKTVSERTMELTKALVELQKTQKQIVAREKLASLGELTAGIAHEIRNPLNLMTNFAELTKGFIETVKIEIESERQNIHSKKYESLMDSIGFIQFNMKKIHKHGERANSIVSSMLLHSRVGGADFLPTDINKLLDEYINLVFHGTQAKDHSFNITIKKRYDEDLPKVNVIPQDIGRVFLNIVQNAFYSAEKKHKTADKNYIPMLNVSTKNLDDKVKIRICDNGLGISKNVLDKLFNPFFTTKPAGEGTGLGLSISYDIIVQEHKGELTIETEEGEYAEFIIVLPK